jgi:Kef-type K+ transport system membrane component KefB
MSILNQITIILISSVFFGAILKYLKQPIFLAHIFVGFLVGTYFFNGIDVATNNQFFEIFVSILLFISGLSINLKHLKDLGEDIIFKNVLTFFILGIVFYFCLIFLGFEVLESIILSICLSLSSSVVLNKLISDDLLHRNLFTKLASSHILIQSIFLGLSLIFLNSLTSVKFDEIFYETALENFLKSTLLILNLYLISKYIISRFEKFIASSNEFLFLFVLSFGFGVVSLFKFLNLSYELGALVAGIMLSIHSFSNDVISKFKVLREISLLGFFIFLGSALDINVLSNKFLLIFVLLLILLITKLFVYLTIEKLYVTPIRESFFSSLSLSSLSEFSLIIVLIAVSKDLINSEIFSVIGFLYVFMAVCSIYFIKHRDFFYNNYFDFWQLFKSKQDVKEKIKEVDVLLLGCGKLGSDFVSDYKYLKSKFLVVDYDLEVLKNLNKLKINNIYGDLSDMEFFETLPYLNSKLIYISISDSSVTLEILKRLKLKKYYGVKIAVSYRYEDTLEFYRMGADYVVMPEFITGKYLADLTLDLGFEPRKYLFIKNLHLDSLKFKEGRGFN